MKIFAEINILNTWLHISSKTPTSLPTALFMIFSLNKNPVTSVTIYLSQGVAFSTYKHNYMCEEIIVLNLAHGT